MKSCAKILFGIFCMLTSFMLLHLLLSIEGSADAISTVLLLAQFTFFIFGLCYGISGIAGIDKELKK